VPAIRQVIGNDIFVGCRFQFYRYIFYRARQVGQRHSVSDRSAARHKRIAKIAVAGGILLLLALVLHFLFAAHFLRVTTVGVIPQTQSYIDKRLCDKRAEVKDQYGRNNFHYPKYTYKINTTKPSLLYALCAKNSVCFVVKFDCFNHKAH
jgi:hypothetical protein